MNRYLAWLIGADPDTRVHLAHSLPFSLWWVVLIWLGGIVWVVAAYRRCRRQISGRRWLMLTLLRAAAVTLLLAVILPGWQLKRELTDRPDLLVIIDDSSSMLQVDRYVERAERLVDRWFSKSPQLVTRLDLAKLLLVRDDVLETWQNRYRLRVLRVATTARELPGEGTTTSRVVDVTSSTEVAEHQSSRLGEEVVRLLRNQRGRPLAAIVVISDGIATVGRSLAEAAEYADRKHVPLFCIGVGDTVPNRDAEVREVLADRTVFLGDTVQVDVSIAVRALQGESLKLLLQRKESGEVLDQQTVVAPLPGETALHRLSFRPDALGQHHLVVSIDPVRDEVNLSNNRLPFQVDVRDETIRVLYVQGYPSPDFRFLKMLLTRKRKVSDADAKAVALTAIQFEAETGSETFQDSDGISLPTDVNQLSNFDVVIVGDVPSRRLPTDFQRALNQFVTERGGGLLLLAGPRHMPQDFAGSELDSLFPVQLDALSFPEEGVIASRGLPFRPTRAGLQVPPIQIADSREESLAVWGQMPTVRWFARAERLRPAAQSWLELVAPGSRYDGVPLVVAQYVGAGRVVCHLTDESYRWSRHPDGEYGYEHYWMQLLRYLAHNKLLTDQDAVALSTDKEVYSFEEQVTVRARFFDPASVPTDDGGVRVELTRDGFPGQDIGLSRHPSRRDVFDVTLRNLEPGSYRIRLVAPFAEGEPRQNSFRIRPPQGEMEQLELDESSLRSAAEKSGGKYARWPDAERIWAALPMGRRVRVSTLPPQPLWNSHWVAVLFVLCLATEWLLRRRWGLV